MFPVPAGRTCSRSVLFMDFLFTDSLIDIPHSKDTSGLPQIGQISLFLESIWIFLADDIGSTIDIGIHEMAFLCDIQSPLCPFPGKSSFRHSFPVIRNVIKIH